MATFLRKSSREMSRREPREEPQHPGMLPPFRQGTVLVLTRSEQLAGVVAHALDGLGSSGPRLSTVQTLAVCLVALRLLAPCLVILDDAVTGQSGAEALVAWARTR